MLTWSNIVMLAVLPHISDFATRLELPIPVPITASQVLAFKPNPEGKVEGTVLLTNGYCFWFERGHVSEFKAHNAYKEQRDPGALPRFFSPVRLSQDQAIAAARGWIRRLGFEEKSLYANLEPRVRPPPKVGTNYVARYDIKWERPNEKELCLEMEIDATTGRLPFMVLFNKNAEKPDPVVNASPPPELVQARRSTPIQDTAEKRQFAERALPQINNLIRCLKLKCGEMSLAQAAKVTASIRDKVVSGSVQFTNDWTFWFFGDTNTIVAADFVAPDVFFWFGREINLDLFVGKPKISEEDALRIAKACVERFDSTIELTSDLDIDRPNLPQNIVVPRRQFVWETSDGFISVEVDLKTGNIKGFHAYEGAEKLILNKAVSQLR